MVIGVLMYFAFLFLSAIETEIYGHSYVRKYDPLAVTGQKNWEYVMHSGQYIS